MIIARRFPSSFHFSVWAAAIVLCLAPSRLTATPTIIVESVPRSADETWVWRKPSIHVQSVDINLVRANIVVEPSDSANVEVIIVAEGDRGVDSAVSFVVSQQDKRYRVVDRYPAKSSKINSIECLPPVDERGDFWNHQVALTVTLRVPRQMHVIAHTMAGTVADRR